MTYYEVRTEDRRRYSALSLPECQEYAKRIYRAEGVIPEIFEIENSSH